MNEPYKRIMIGNRRVVEHVAIVEGVLGYKLPDGVQVHHVDSDGKNNKHTNLVVCPDQSYHRLLHTRTQALEASGHPDWLQCRYCKQWDNPQNLTSFIPKRYSGYRSHHRKCHSEAEKRRNRDSSRLHNSIP